MPKRSYSAIRKRAISRAGFKRTRALVRPFLIRNRSQMMRIGRGWASRTLNTHRFTRYAANTSIVDVTAPGTSNNHVFTLDKIVNASEFQSLFDQYRIDKVVVTYRLITNPDSSNILNTAGAFPQPTNWFPSVWSIVDYDDNSSMNINEMKERIGVKHRILKPDRPLKYVVRPKVLVQTYRTAVSAGYAPKSLFVDMTNIDIPHYGLKTTIDTGGLTTGAQQPFRIQQEFKYFFTCKNVR